jgi:hypothetical protein
MTDLSEKEILLTEMMEISEQIELWKDHLIKEILSLVEKRDDLTRADPSLWSKSSISILVSTKNFNTIIFGLMENFKTIQEVVLKKKVSVIISNSVTIRKLFYESPETLAKAMTRKGSFESDSSEYDENSSTCSQSLNPNDYLDEFFFCLEETSLRVIKTLNKVSIFSILNFVSSMILGEDLVKIMKV